MAYFDLYKISRVSFLWLLLLLSLVLIVEIEVTPWLKLPSGFDGHSYESMAEDPIASREKVASHHYQRILPSVMVWAFCKVTGQTVPTGFIILSRVLLLFLALQIFLILLSRLQDPVYAAGLGFILLFQSWPLSYNIINIWQLADLLTFIFTILLAWAVYKKILGLFFVCSVLAIFTRQNLLVLAAMGSLYFLFDTLQEMKRPSYIVKVILGIFILTLLAVFSFHILAKDKGVGAAYHLFAFELGGIGFKAIGVPFFLLSPFLLVFAFHIKKVVKVAIRLWPVTIFAMVTIFQPYSYWLPTGIDNAMRIMAPGVFLLCLHLAVMVGRDFKRELPAKWGWAIMGVVPLMYGTSHLFSTGPVLKPLFFLPGGFRFLVNILFVIPGMYSAYYLDVICKFSDQSLHGRSV